MGSLTFNYDGVDYTYGMDYSADRLLTKELQEAQWAKDQAKWKEAKRLEREAAQKIEDAEMEEWFQSQQAI